MTLCFHLALLLHVAAFMAVASPTLMNTPGLIFAVGFENVNPHDNSAQSGTCGNQVGNGQFVLSDRPCVYGLCALFNQTTISCARPVNFMSNSAYTVAAWLSPYVNQWFPGTMVFFNVFGIMNEAQQFGINSWNGMYPLTFANVPRLYVNDDWQTFLNGTSYEFPFVSTPSQWTHVAFVFDGAYVRLYINATLQSAFIGPTDMSITSNSYSFNVGSPSRQTQGLIPYQGLMDELGIFNIALTQSQINNLYNVGNPPNSTPTTGAPTIAESSTPTTGAPTIAATNEPQTYEPTNAVSPTLLNMPGCVGAMGFDITSALDSIGLASSCTIDMGNGEYGLLASQCIFGTCMLLNASRISCTELTSGWPTSPSGAYTVAAWIAPFLSSSITGVESLFNVVDANSNSVQFGINSYGMAYPNSFSNVPSVISNSAFQSYISGSSYAFPFAGANPTDWTHVAYVSNGSVVRLYINATLQSAVIGGSIQPIAKLPFEFNIGSVAGSNWDVVPFQGRVDELGIFNIELTQSQINDLYNVANAPAPTMAATSNTPTTEPTIRRNGGLNPAIAPSTEPTLFVPQGPIVNSTSDPTSKSTRNPTLAPALLQTSLAPSTAPTTASLSVADYLTNDGNVTIGIWFGVLVLVLIAVWFILARCCCNRYSGYGNLQNSGTTFSSSTNVHVVHDASIKI